MRQSILIAAGGLLVGVAYLWRRQAEQGGDVGQVVAVEVEQITTGLQSAVDDIVKSLSGYTPEKVPAQYREAIASAESANGIPSGMLARLLWQESRYRQEIIDGRKKSPVGAVGIAQFMPATAAEWGVNPLDPFSSIAGAGRYLAWLYKQAGAWPEALAAYNWGIGNVKRKGIAKAPTETRNYFSQILADIGINIA